MQFDLCLTKSGFCNDVYYLKALNPESKRWLVKYILKPTEQWFYEDTLMIESENLKDVCCMAGGMGFKIQVKNVIRE